MSEHNSLALVGTMAIQQTEEGKKATEEHKANQFRPVIRRPIAPSQTVDADGKKMITVTPPKKGSFVTVPPELMHTFKTIKGFLSLIAMMKVRNVSKEGALTTAEKRAGKKGRPEKVVKPIDSLDLSTAMVFDTGKRSIIHEEEINIRKKVFHTDMGTAGHCEGEAIFGAMKRNMSLPKIEREAKEGIIQAFRGAKESSQITLSLEGVTVRSLSEDAKDRVSDPEVPTWFLYSEGNPYPTPEMLPHYTALKERDALARVQTVFIHKLITSGLIDLAIYALPFTEEDKGSGRVNGKQWAHKAKIKLVHCGKTGQKLATAKVVNHTECLKKEAIEGKDGVTKEGFVKTAADTKTYRIDYRIQGLVSTTWTSNENQARSAVYELMGLGAADQATIIAPMGKELDPSKYPPTVADTLGKQVSAWNCDLASATLTRQGFAALQKTPDCDKYKPSRNRGAFQAPKWKMGGPWQKVHNDRSTFSGG